MSYRTQLGSALKAARLQRGLTQKQLAQKIGAAQPYVAGIESGVQVISLDRLVEICKILQCVIDIRITPVD
jgi:UDP-N-acetylglucosamine 1-carboxyvinyltransferase